MLEAGANCNYSNTGVKWQINAAELIYMLEPIPEHPDPNRPGQTVPERGGAVIIEASEYKRLKDAAELACRMLGNNCKYEGVNK